MIALQQGIRTCVTAFVTFTLFQFYHLSEGYWAVLTALVLVQVHFNDSFTKNIFLLVACSVLIACNTLIASYMSNELYYLASYLLCTTFISVYLGLLNASLFLPAFAINLFGAISAGMPVDGHFIAMRFACVMLGALIALGVRCALWPPRLKTHLKELLVESLEVINQLQIRCITIYLKRDYQDQHYFYEKELHKQRLQFFSIMQKIHELLNKIGNKKKSKTEVVVNDINMLFEVVMALGNLRYREKDHTSFGMMFKEFTFISKYMTSTLRYLSQQIRNKKNTKMEMSGFKKAIKSIHSIYQTTLQVTTKEPTAYLIFIRNLEAVYTELNRLELDILKC